jgi:DNA-binding IclR family transcriptional regulator
VVAAISIAGPTSRLRPEVIPQRAAQVVDAANQMSLALGCPEEVVRPARLEGGN